MQQNILWYVSNKACLVVQVCDKLNYELLWLQILSSFKICVSRTHCSKIDHICRMLHCTFMESDKAKFC